MPVCATRGSAAVPDRVWDDDPTLHAEAETERARHWTSNKHAREAWPNQPARPFDVVHYREIEPRLRDQTIIAGLCNAGETSLLVGASGAGKSFLAIDISIRTASGGAWFERRTNQCGVLYIASETGRGIINRIAAYKQNFSDLPNDLPFVAIVSPVDLHDPQAELCKILDEVPKLGLSHKVRLIIVDTLSRAMGGGDENSPEGMGSFVFNIDALRHATGAHVMIVHHLGKDATKGARGHSLLKAAVDTEIEVNRDDATRISTARVTKQRELPTGGGFSFSLRTVELGQNQFGEPVTSCVVQPEECAIDVAKKPPKLSHAQGRALQLLAEAIELASEIPPASNHIPPATRCVIEDVWRDYCYRGAVSAGDQDAKRKAFKRAAEALIAAGRVGKWDPWVWLIP